MAARTSALNWVLGLYGKRGAVAVCQAYQRAFADNHIVLADLARLGFDRETPFIPGDTTTTAFNCGMQAMWFHIRDRLDLTSEEIEAAERDLLRFQTQENHDG